MDTVRAVSSGVNMTAEELCIEVSVQSMIEALEDSGDYKVFTDDSDGIENAIDWITDESDVDTILGPIDSESIIKHLENSIDAMVVRMQEEPNDHLIGEFVQYLQREGYIGNLISMMRATGVPLEKIMRHYIGDALSEEKSMMNRELY